MGKETKIKRVFTYLVCFTICCFLYGLCHELIGHGLTAILLSGSIDSIHLFGFKVFPNFGWSGIPGGLGIDDLPTGKLLDIVIIMGPISTWLVSLLAVIALWIRYPTGLLRVVLVCLSFWCYDLLGEALMVWGIPKYLFFHSDSPGHYEAAIRLGVQDPLFHIFSIGTSVCILAGVVLRLIYDHKQLKR
jgi:hypothetical protein